MSADDSEEATARSAALKSGLASSAAIARLRAKAPNHALRKQRPHPGEQTTESKKVRRVGSLALPKVLLLLGTLVFAEVTYPLGTTYDDSSIQIVNFVSRKISVEENGVVVVSADAYSAANTKPRRVKENAVIRVNTVPARERLCDTYFVGQLVITFADVDGEEMLCFETARDEVRLPSANMDELLGKRSPTMSAAWYAGNLLILNLSAIRQTLITSDASGRQRLIALEPRAVMMEKVNIGYFEKHGPTLALGSSGNKIVCRSTGLAAWRKYVVLVNKDSANCVSF